MSKWHGNPWAVLLTLSLGFLMTLIDLTIVNIAIPSMMDQLDASLDHVLWVINAYALVLAVLLITAGRLGDLRGQRNLFIAGVAIFTLASLACGLAQTPGQLIGARVVQGVGAAALMPQTMAIIVATFPAQRRGTALGIWGAVAGLATIIGPTLGGLLVSAAGWRWIFLINIPIGLLVLAASFAIIPDTRLQRRHRFDWVGVAVATTALFCIAFALTEGQRYAWNGWIWASLAAGLLLVGAFLAHQRTRQDAEPLVPFALFRDRNFAIMNFVGAAVSVGILGFFIIITVYLQSVLGYSALKAGLVLATASVLSTLVAPMAGRLADRWGGKFILAGGLVLFAVGAAWISAIADVGTPWPAFQAPLVVLGTGMGFVFAPMVTEAMRGVPPALAGAASGLINTIRQVGAVLGSAAVGALLQGRLAAALQDEATARAGEIPEAYRGPFLAGFENAGHHGLEAGGRPALDLPVPDVPAAVAAQLERVGTAVFQHAFVDALPWTLTLPIVVILIAALACAGMTRHRRGPEPEQQPEAAPTRTAA